MKALLLVFITWTVLSPALAQTNSSDSQKLIGWLLEEDRELSGVPFADVIQATSGKRLIAFERTNAADRALLAKISSALDLVLERMNAPDSAAQKPKRINEVSSHFEDALREALNAVPGFHADWPHTAAGKVQRSGYPDIRLADKTSGRIVYLDPKLYATASRSSSLRTFYFTPRKDTNKVNDDAHHLIVGIAHDGGGAGRRKFISWELIDLAHFRVRLKAEFQASNKDMYRDDAVVGRSRPTN